MGACVLCLLYVPLPADTAAAGISFAHNASQLGCAPLKTHPVQSSSRNARGCLAALREKKPPAEAAQIRGLWPEIKSALENGHSLKAVCDRLEADGSSITVQTLGSYITRMPRESVPVELSSPAFRFLWRIAET
jgi:hypothetical protein